MSFEHQAPALARSATAAAPPANFGWTSIGAHCGGLAASVIQKNIGFSY